MSLLSIFKSSSPEKKSDKKTQETSADPNNQESAKSALLLSITDKIKELLMNAKNLIALSSEARKRVTGLTTITEEGRSLVKELEIRSAKLPSNQDRVDIVNLATSLEILFDSLKTETDGATKAFEDFFQVTAELDQSVTKTTNSLIGEINAVKLQSLKPTDDASKK